MDKELRKKHIQELKKDILKEQQESGITIRARALNFPMLVHELIKGLYELVSLQGFKGDKEANQGVVDKVDTLSNELHDIKYGKLIFDSLNDIFAESPHSDPRIREFFFSEVYQLEDDEFLEFVENAINEELTPKQKRWVDQTLKEISSDLRSDDYDQEGIDEIKVNNPNLKLNITTNSIPNYGTFTIENNPELKNYCNRDEYNIHLFKNIGIVDTRLWSEEPKFVEGFKKYGGVVSSYQGSPHIKIPMKNINIINK